ncbi:MAG: transcriptional regulator [Planctomycetota bacterium]|nr:transcriptional regulator [Planctomycetota bacterium]
MDENLRKTRQIIRDALKWKGAQDSGSLAEKLGLTPMAVRKHLYAMQEGKLVTSVEEPRPMGRPVKMWSLTLEAEKFYPDGHADLMVNMIRNVRSAFGEKGLKKLVDERGREQLQRYREQLESRQTLRGKLDCLARQRTQEGYMAEVQKEGRKYLFIENHCPICSAANSCQRFCENELDIFQKSLGEDVKVVRREHIVSGARRCVYEVEAGK